MGFSTGSRVIAGGSKGVQGVSGVFKRVPVRLRCVRGFQAFSGAFQMIPEIFMFHGASGAFQGLSSASAFRSTSVAFQMCYREFKGAGDVTGV